MRFVVLTALHIRIETLRNHSLEHYIPHPQFVFFPQDDTKFHAHRKPYVKVIYYVIGEVASGCFEDLAQSEEAEQTLQTFNLSSKQ